MDDSTCGVIGYMRCPYCKRMALVVEFFGRRPFGERWISHQCPSCCLNTPLAPGFEPETSPAFVPILEVIDLIELEFTYLDAIARRPKINLLSVSDGG